MEKNRICHLCGKKYAYCPSCNRDKMKPSWYALFCGEQCKDIDGVLSEYGRNKISQVKAAKELSDLGVSTMSIADADIKRNIADILSASKKDDRAEKTVKE